MKSIYYILLFAFLISSCNTNDDTIQQTPEPSLSGQWSLTNVYGGLADIDNDFELNVIVWDFDAENWVLTVNNNSPDDVAFDGLPSGAYDYQLNTTDGEDVYLTIEGYGISHKVSFPTSTQMLLDEGVALDGFLLTFNK